MHTEMRGVVHFGQPEDWLPCRADNKIRYLLVDIWYWGRPETHIRSEVQRGEGKRGNHLGRPPLASGPKGFCWPCGSKG